MFEKLQGYKTYIVAVCVGLVATAQYLGWVNAETALIFYGLLGGVGTATMAAKVNRMANE